MRYQGSTNTDPKARRTWCVNDEVMRLRTWGQDAPVYVLPSPRVRCKMGTASEMLLEDKSGLTSREHAELIPVIDAGGGWKLRDLNSKNGLRCDGERQASFKLRPGVEVEIGGLRLIAESPQLLRALEALRCQIGWTAEQQPHVDAALQCLRGWAAQRGDLLIRGEGPLDAVVRRLHGLVIGSGSPFTIVNDGDDPDAVVQAALGGTLCLPLHRQSDAAAVVERVHALDYSIRPQLVVCAELPSMAMTIKRILDRPAVIEFPDLATRPHEIERIVRELVPHAVTILGVREAGLTMHDLERLNSLEYPKFAVLEETVLRLVAIRALGVMRGAARLGLDHSSLSSWARAPTRKLLL